MGMGRLEQLEQEIAQIEASVRELRAVPEQLKDVTLREMGGFRNAYTNEMASWLALLRPRWIERAALRGAPERIAELQCREKWDFDNPLTPAESDALRTWESTGVVNFDAVDALGSRRGA